MVSTKIIRESTHVEKNDDENDGDFALGENVFLDERLRSIGGAAFARKVRTAASAVLAPCVGPTLPSFLRQSSPSMPYKNISHGGDALFESVSGLISVFLVSKMVVP